MKGVELMVHVVMWIFVGALVVLIVTHARGFATAVSAVGGQVTSNASLLTGAGIGTTGKKAA